MEDAVVWIQWYRQPIQCLAHRIFLLTNGIGLGSRDWVLYRRTQRQ